MEKIYSETDSKSLSARVYDSTVWIVLRTITYICAANIFKLGQKVFSSFVFGNGSDEKSRGRERNIDDDSLSANFRSVQFLLTISTTVLVFERGEGESARFSIIALNII